MRGRFGTFPGVIRSRRALALVVVPVLLLGACASGGGAGSTEPATVDDIGSRATPAGIAPDLVYVTDVEGCDLAVQSVGVSGDDGFSATYTREVDDRLAMVALRTARTSVIDPSVVVPCDELTDTQTTLLCGVVRGEAFVSLEGTDVDAATLRAAGEAVRVPTVGELPHLFSEVRVPDGPVERGDLPEEGDGAPIDPDHAGG